MVKTPLTGVDSTTAILLTFGETRGSGLSAQAVLSCSIQLPPQNPAVTIRFERGIIEIPAPIHSPRFYVLKYIEHGNEAREEKRTIDFVGHGLHFQADEVARCVRSGKGGSSIWTHDDSLMEMTIFDEVRRQGGYAVYTVLDQ